MQYVWQMFVSLHNATSGHISYQEIQAYAEFNGRLTPFEVEAVMTLQNIRMQHD